MGKGGLSVGLAEIGCKDMAGLYWSDEMRVGLIGQIRRAWAPRGVKVEQMVECKREWAYLNLVVNGLTGQLRWGWAENVRGVSTLVWDRARGHRRPPYSPELNLAGRVFGYLRSKIEGRTNGTMAARKSALEAELEKLAAV